MKRIKESGLKFYRNWSLLAFLTFLLALGALSTSLGKELDGQVVYVGSLACRECHPEEYDNFMTYTKKSSSFQSIEKQMKHLTPDEIKQCYPCHTTGY